MSTDASEARPPSPPDIPIGGRGGEALRGIAALRTTIERVVRTLRTDPTSQLMVLGAVIGLFSGLVAGGFDWAIQQVGIWVLGSSEPSAARPLGLAPLYGPILGGIVAGVAIRWGTRRGQPASISDVIDATCNRGGSLSLRNGAATALGAVAAVGGGQSGGREGPVVQLSAAVASHLCRRVGVPPNRARVLVAAGAAAGIAASFNTPVGAAFFALEIILGNFAMNLFGPVVAATVAGTVVGQALLGDRVALALPTFALKSPVELPLYALLGGLAGGLSLLLRRLLWLAEDQMKRLPLPTFLHPAVAGLAVGIVAMLGMHQVMGNGYAGMELMIRDEYGLGFWMLLLLLVAKLVTTAITSAGRSGVGLFAPSLFLGTVLGVAFGHGVHGMWPDLTESAGAYGIVGMGAVTAAVTQSPITIMLMIFEMTRNYQVILPMLLALAVAGIVVTAFGGGSVYVEKLKRSGIRLDRGREDLVIHDLKVADLMREGDLATIRPDAPFEELAALLLIHREDEVWVVEEDGRLHGLVALLDIRAHLIHPKPGLRVADVETRSVPAVRPDQSVAEALPLFFRAEVDDLPVIDLQGRLLGVLSERDVVGALDREVLRHDALLARVQSDEPDGGRHTDFFELPPGQVMRSIEVGEAMAGQTLRELLLTRRYHATVIAVSREDPVTGRNLRLPADADLVLIAGDRLVVVGPREDIDALGIDQDDLAETEEVPIVGLED